MKEYVSARCFHRVIIFRSPNDLTRRPFSNTTTDFHIQIYIHHNAIIVRKNSNPANALKDNEDCCKVLYESLA